MRYVVAVVVGAALGFLWHKLSGGACPTHTCPLSGNPWISILLGAVMGGFFVAR